MNKTFLLQRLNSIVGKIHPHGDETVINGYCDPDVYDNIVAHLITDRKTNCIELYNGKIIISLLEYPKPNQLDLVRYSRQFFVTLLDTTSTKGDVIVEDIEIGDIHYEFEYGFCVKSKVISVPVLDETGYWSWQSKQLSGTTAGTIINYGVAKGFGHYGPNLYTYDAYSGCKMT